METPLETPLSHTRKCETRFEVADRDLGPYFTSFSSLLMVGSNEPECLIIIAEKGLPMKNTLA